METLTRSDALQLGLPKYYTGKPCGRGHVSERYVSTFQCVQCMAGHAKVWKASNPERYKEINKKYRDSVPEKVKVWKSESQKRNREAANARKKRWEDKNRERVNARIAQWQKANPEKSSARTMRRHAAKLQRVPGWADQSAIGMIYRAAQLARVTWPDVEIHVDHVIPLRGKTVSGLHVHHNLQILTGFANRTKSIQIERN